MQAYLKEQWIDALENRDGHYKKTDAGLHVNGCHCGLGILCDIMQMSEFEDTSGYMGYRFGSIQESEDYYKLDSRFGDMITGYSKEFLDEVELSKEHHDRIMELNSQDGEDSYQSVIDYIRTNV